MTNNGRYKSVRIMESRLILYSVLIACMLTIIYTAFDLVYRFSSRGEKVLTDFHTFYIVGKMFWNGSIEHAYHFETMLEAQSLMMGTLGFMPWAYPPYFNFVVAVLPILPLELSYLFFVFISFSFYVLVLRRLSGDYLGAVLISIAPAMLIAIRCGQNGFVTGALVGLFAIAILNDRSWAGLPLGLMVIKPHLAAGVALFSVVMRRWSVMAIAILVLSVSSLLVTVYLGQGIWISFFNGAKEASKFLELGLYPLNRMISLYASLRSFGFSAGVALAAQIVVALCSCFLVIYVWWRNWKLGRVLGVAALASLYVSPYGYDYDLTILGVAAALLMQDIDRHTSGKEKFCMILLSWVGGAWGLVTSFIYQKPVVSSLYENRPISLAGIGLLILFLVVFNVIKRAQDYDDVQHRRHFGAVPARSGSSPP